MYSFIYYKRKMLKNQCLDGLRCFSVNFKYTVHKTIIFRYLFRELITPFFLGLSVFIFILIMSQILRLNELIIVYGVGIGTVLRLMFYLLIGFLAISIPIALIFSVLMVFGRLSSDSEITALKASGFSILQLAMPVLLFSVIVFIFCLYLTLYLEPWGGINYRRVIFEIGQSKATVGIKEGVFNDDFFGLVLYTDKLNPKEKTLEHVFLYDKRDKEKPIAVVAEKGALISSPDLPNIFLVLSKGNIHSTPQNADSIQKISFDRYTINLALSAMMRVDTREKRGSELFIEGFQQEIAKAKKEKKFARARMLESEYYKKYSVAFVNIIFAVLGIALGIRPTRAVKSFSFVFTLLLVGVYWLLYMNAQRVAVLGTLPASVSMWVPNILYAAIAGYLIFRANRR